jgi:hypothetical protein
LPRGPPRAAGVLDIRAPFATITVFDAALQQIADIWGDLGDTDDLDKRRVKALLVLSRPDLAAGLIEETDGAGCGPGEPRSGPRPEIDWSRLLPAVTVYLHTYRGVDTAPT